MKLYSMSAIISFFLLFFACSGGGDTGYEASTSESAAVSKDLSQQQEAEEIKSEQKLIKNGSVHFETKSVTESQKEITNLVKQYNGYLSDQQQNDYNDRVSYTVQARLPSANFDDFFQSVVDHAHRIESQNITVEDVTQEFIDVESRIKTKKELEQRYTQLLTKADSVEDILKIEREIGALRSDIESMEGRLQYLKDQTRYSTIDISFYQTNTKDFGFFSKFTQAFATGWQALLSFIIGLVTLWPFFIIIGLIIYLLRKFKVFKRN